MLLLYIIVNMLGYLDFLGDFVTKSIVEEMTRSSMIQNSRNTTLSERFLNHYKELLL
jgi:hypothetical protein